MSSSESRSWFSRDEWVIIAVTSLGHALCHLSEQIYHGVTEDVMGEFSIGPERATRLFLPGLILFGVGAVPSGLWTDRRGAREVMASYFFILAAATSSALFVRSPTGLGVMLTVLGVAISVYHPAGLAMLAHGCRRRGLAMGINGVAGSIGLAFGSYLGLLMAQLGDWRWAYVITAGICLIAGVATLFCRSGSDSHRTAGKLTDSRNGLKLGIIFLFLAMFVGGFNYRCFTTALPPYLGGGAETPERKVGVTEQADGLSDESSGVPPKHKAPGYVLLVLALGGIGQFVGGHLADRFNPAVMYILFIALTSPFAFLMAQSDTVLVAGGALAVFMFAQQPVENAMVAEATPARWRSTIYGLKFIITFGLGAFGIRVAGMIWERSGLVKVFVFLAVNALVMAVFATCYWLSHRSRPVAINEPSEQLPDRS